jgi:hypothetical protein
MTPQKGERRQGCTPGGALHNNKRGPSNVAQRHTGWADQEGSPPMTWTKLGDEFGDECWTLSDKAFRLHAEGLCWSNRMLTDGQLAKEDMRRWAHHPDAAEELVDVGWWEDHGAHYQIIHHLGYQRTKKQVAKQSNANAENANRRWTKKKPPQDNPSNDSQCDSQSDSTYEMDRTGQAFKRGGEKKRRAQRR